MKDVVGIGTLMDLYENLLTEKQKKILNWYINEDYSLNEISELAGITRQAAHDTIKKSLKLLENFEDTLGLKRHNEDMKEQLENIKSILNRNGIKIVDGEIDLLISVL